MHTVSYKNGAINSMGTSYKPPKVTFSAMVDAHTMSLTHVPEKVQNLVNEHMCRSNGFMNKDK
jgi:hypothetical protein